MVVSRSWRWGKDGDVGYRVQTPNYKSNNLVHWEDVEGSGGVGGGRGDRDGEHM